MFQFNANKRDGCFHVQNTTICYFESFMVRLISVAEVCSGASEKIPNIDNTFVIKIDRCQDINVSKISLI